MTLPLIWLTKEILLFSRLFGFGAGSTWPGQIMLSINPSFLREFGKKFKGKIIIIAGTNGKTTTSKIIRTILEASGKTVIHNESGANLLNGLASTLIQHSNLVGRWHGDYAIFEVDENTLSLLLNELTPNILVILNLFRDQLDRYGEVDTVAKKWRAALDKLPKNTQVVLNADDPHVAFLGKALAVKISYFGIDDKKLYINSRPHAMDAIYCPNCGKRLTFEGIYFAHLGKWRCDSCNFSRLKPNFNKIIKILPGIYNLYNVQAALLTAQKLGLKGQESGLALRDFSPAFGRQEKFMIEGKAIKIFLSKNPAGFNESIRTVKELGGKNILLVLNDRIPDGRDVSWIWDVDFEELNSSKSIIISGDRAYDLGLRIKYSFKTQNSKLKSQNHSAKLKIFENLREAIQKTLEAINENETLYILPTYSAMLEVRKILTGREIL